ncbi:MAG: hypothetical protein ACTHLJ_11925 [Angustibacter sp.]
MNPRQVVVEDRVLALADAVDADDPMLAARLRECVPDGFGNCDEHVPLMREVLVRVAVQLPAHERAVDRLLGALDDLPSVIGRRGRVWVGQDPLDSELFSAYWDDEAGWLEERPEPGALTDVLAWAERRSDDVRVQPSAQ